GLWLTVQRLPGARRPGLLTLLSLIIRLGVTLAGFYLVMAGRWERLLVCLAGFLLVRILLVRRLGPSSSPSAGA
ncbi:MAG: ATP synthase subunit I, partial [Thermodesulfobacteriota bacterium]